MISINLNTAKPNLPVFGEDKSKALNQREQRFYDRAMELPLKDLERTIHYKEAQGLNNTDSYNAQKKALTERQRIQKS